MRQHINHHPNQPMTNDQAAFLAHLQAYRLKGAQALLDNGAEPDPLLIQELCASGADQRYGVNLIVRPPPHVVSYIHAVQERLRTHEPDQYFYPAGDLHLTLIELCSSRPQREVETLAATVAQALPAMAHTAPRALLVRPLLGYDRRACALNFLPADDALQTLRRHLVNSLARHGIAIAPRYAPQSAHVTLMRYLRPLQTDRTSWLEILTHAAPRTTLEWPLDAIWLTWGATWYGMQGRAAMCGPYTLWQTESQQPERFGLRS
jgi:2'-5' RNA ligase